MITIISGTNRPNSRTAIFSKAYFDIIIGKTDQEVHLIDLAEISQDWLHSDMYHAEMQSSTITQIQDKYILPAEKFIVLSPEYNGSIPGVLKLFIDALSIREYAINFKNKKGILAGVATGRAGNLRGIDHLADMFNHMGMHIHPQKQPFSSVQDYTDMEAGTIKDDAILKVIEGHVDTLLAW